MEEGISELGGPNKVRVGTVLRLVEGRGPRSTLKSNISGKSPTGRSFIALYQGLVMPIGSPWSPGSWLICLWEESGWAEAGA